MAKELTPRQSQAIVLMAQGQPLSEVAQAIGVSANTLFRWKAEELFKAALDKTTQQIQAEVEREIRKGVLLAAKKLTGIMLDEESPRHTQLQAAEQILNRFDKVIKKSEHQPENGLSLSQCHQFIDYFADSVLSDYERTIAWTYKLLGFIQDEQEYQAWSQSRRAFYALVVDWMSQYWEGIEKPVLSPDSVAWYKFCLATDSLEGLAWLMTETNE